MVVGKRRSQYRRPGYVKNTTGEGKTRSTCLSNLKPGASGKVLKLSGNNIIRQHLFDLGIMPQRDIVVVRNAYADDVMEVRVGRTFVEVKREEAARVEVMRG